MPPRMPPAMGAPVAARTVPWLPLAPSAPPVGVPPALPPPPPVTVRVETRWLLGLGALFWLWLMVGVEAWLLLALGALFWVWLLVGVETWLLLALGALFWVWLLVGVVPLAEPALALALLALFFTVGVVP